MDNASFTLLQCVTYPTILVLLHPELTYYISLPPDASQDNYGLVPVKCTAQLLRPRQGKRGGQAGLLYIY